MAKDLHPPPIPSAAAAVRPRLAGIIVAGGLLLIVAFLVLWLRRPSDAIALQVDEIFGRVRQLERSEGRIANWARSLPGPLSMAGEWFFPQSQEDNDTLAEKLGELGTNAVPFLIPRLTGDASVAVRTVAAMALGNLGDPAAFGPLTNAVVRDQTAGVRVAAVDALRELALPEIVPVLLQALRTDTNETVRYSAAFALGAMADSSVILDLLALARVESDWEVRACLAATFAQHRTEAAVPIMADWILRPATTDLPGGSSLPPGLPRRVFEVELIVESLGSLGGEAAFQTLTNFWSTAGGQEMRETLCTAFGFLGDARALPFLQEALTGPAAVQVAAIGALGNLGDTNVLSSLLPFCENRETEVRHSAYMVLGQLGGTRMVPTLLAALESELNQAPVSRTKLCEVLGEIGDPAALPAILQVFHSLSKDREEVIWAVGHLGDSNAIPVLATMLSSTSREESFAAAYALVEIGGDAAAVALAGQLAHEDEFARHGKACALAMLGGTNGLPTVRDGLSARETWRRFGAILAIARLGLPSTAAEWQRALHDRDPALRQLAEAAVAGRVVAGLVQLLQDADSDYRRYAARGLVFFRDPDCLPALRLATRDRDKDVRRAARLAAALVGRSTENH